MTNEKQIEAVNIENRLQELLQEATTLYVERIQLCETSEEIKNWKVDFDNVSGAFSDLRGGLL